MRTACHVLLAATTLLTPALLAVGAAPAAEAAAATTALSPVAPCRLADAGSGSGFQRLDSHTIRVQVAGRCGVNAASTAAALTVTADHPTVGGFVTVFPAGTTRPVVSNLNFQAGEQVSNGAVVALSASGAVDVFASSGGDVDVDVTGGFIPAVSSAAGRFVAVTPVRALDTRTTNTVLPAGGSRTVPLPAGVPADAVAVAANLTAVGALGVGAVVAGPAGTAEPDGVTLTVDTAGQTRAAASIIPTTASGFTVFSQSGGHMVVDVTGYFTGPSAGVSSVGMFVPVTPTRLIDTRGVSALGSSVPLYPNGSVEVAAASVSTAGALALNVTTVSPGGRGYLTAYPAQTSKPTSSSVNSDRAGDTQANLWIGAQSTSGVAFTQSVTSAHLVVDLAGWFTGVPAAGFNPRVAVLNVPPQPAMPDPLAPVTSPNSGAWCANGTDAASLNAFFSQAHGTFYGADYQRSYRLPDGRVLWMFQDAFITNTAGVKTLQHNVGMIQSGRCFSLLRAGTSAVPKSWILWDKTVDRHVWYWPMGGAPSADGKTFQLFMAEMTERGSGYLTKTEPTAMYIVNIRVSDLWVTGYAKAPDTSGELYGWSVTSDSQWTYLYGHCYKQFGWGFLGHDACTQYMKVARVPKGQVWAAPQYWNGTGWASSAAAAVPVVSSATFGGTINPGQVMFDGTRFNLIIKEGDWWGSVVYVGTSTSPTGPWTRVTTVTPAVKCSSCNTYFASWIPWRNPDGKLIWGLSHNRWDGAISSVYRPSVSAVAVI